MPYAGLEFTDVLVPIGIGSSALPVWFGMPPFTDVFVPWIVTLRTIGLADISQITFRFVAINQMIAQP